MFHCTKMQHELLAQNFYRLVTHIVLEASFELINLDFSLVI